MKCIGKNPGDELRLCACFMRQHKGCIDDKMRSGKNVRKNFRDILEKIDWSKITVCQGVNEYSEEGRTCLCLGGQKLKSCTPQMRIVSLTKADVIANIEDLNC